MSAQETPARKPRWFPGLRIRPAQSNDFPRMARMANEIFQHERDIDHFNKHRRVKMGYEPEASAADRLLAAETDWRLADMRKNRRIPGRHFIVATYIKRPAGYLTRRHGAHPREELLGWAEWQDPGLTAAEPALKDGFSDSDQSESSHGRWKMEADSALDGLESVLEGMTLVHDNQALFVPSNGLAVPMSEAVESFQRARTDDPEEWKLWYKVYLRNFLGQNGDPYGMHLVLRSLVINTAHWDDGVGLRLLKWGMKRADAHRWAVDTLASSASVSTLDSFRDAGFMEVSRLDIFRDTQIALLWWGGFRELERRNRIRMAGRAWAAGKPLSKWPLPPHTVEVEE